MVPGKITSWGANTIGASYDTPCSREWRYVDFLEPSAFSVRRTAIKMVYGFDFAYQGVAEWCDVDLVYRMRRYGYKMIFHPQLYSEHYPVKGDKVYNLRLKTSTRYRNYVYFANKHLKPSLKNMVYRAFLWSYFMWRGR